ncbi:MAG: cyclopropane-fatty-acyl-phospholipid synthase [Saprospiraceae bacterium]|jgi:cyclopropane-fatty-acyl-phospholipid synthase
MNYKTYVIKKLNEAGVAVNETGPQALQVHNSRFYKAVALNGSLGFAESYVDGDWSCDSLDQLINALLRNGVRTGGMKDFKNRVRAQLLNMQSVMRSNRVAQTHYDVDTQVFEWMLDPYLQYTCGYWKGQNNLNDAQTAKMDLVINKLRLKAGDTLLDIGCGWGGFAKYAAEVRGLTVKGISISRSQLAYAEKQCVGLDCEFKFGDYRYLDKIYPQKFDAISIIGVTEHIGHKNFEALYRVMNERLKEGGLVLQHTIAHMKSKVCADPFIDKYIFPGGTIPSMQQLSKAMQNYFVAEDVHNFGADYDTTLMAWSRKFELAREQIEANPELGERFYKVWHYYLLSCAGMFRARRAQLLQFVLSPKGVMGGYQRIS